MLFDCLRRWDDEKEEKGITVAARAVGMNEGMIFGGKREMQTAANCPVQQAA